MSLTPDTVLPPFPLTASFTADYSQSQPMQRLVIKLALAPGSYELSVLPDLMVLTSAIGARTPDDVNEFTSEALISSATVVRTVNWWDSSGVFHPGENQVKALQTSPDTLATQAMLDAGIVGHYGEFSFHTATVNIEAARTVTYPSGARDVYTDDYYLVIDGWNLSYPEQTSGASVPLSGRFLVTLGNPTGQRTQTWGGEWLNVQSWFETYQPPFVPPLPPPPPVADLDPLQLPATVAFSTTSDGQGVETPHIADTAEAEWWNSFGQTVLSGYASQALSALKTLADGTGHFNLGAALNVLNAATTAAGIRDYLNAAVAKIWAHDVEGMQLILNPNLSHSQMSAWLARDSALFGETQQGLRDQAGSIVLDQVLPGGGTAYSVLTSIPYGSRQTNSFTLGAWAPGAPLGGDRGTDVVSGGAGADQLQLGAGNDMAAGRDGDDVIAAGDGWDWIAGGAGNDTLDGGSGIDTAMYAGARAAYGIARTTQGVTVTGPEGGDTLTGVERLMFTDTNVGLDIDGTGGKGYRIYQAAFNRTPDPGGLGFWIKVLDGGASLRDVAQGFIGSDEFRTVYGTAPTNAELVTRYYENVLHRAPEAEGYQYWCDVLDQRLDTPAGVLANISEGFENQAGVIGAIGNGFAYTPYG